MGMIPAPSVPLCAGTLYCKVRFRKFRIFVAMPKIRNPTHAGSWYEESPAALEAQIGEWLADVKAEAAATTRAIIAP